MKFTRTSIADVILIEPQLHGDERGYFMETWRQDLFEAFSGLRINFVQDNESKSARGVLRGLHYQLPPAAQSKLVRVVCGKVKTVAVDLRQGSPTFGHHVMEELSAANKRQLFIPRGFAHGFLVLEDNTVYTYKVDATYSPTLERGLAWNDPALAIAWPVPAGGPVLSARDRQQPLLATANTFPAGLALYP